VARNELLSSSSPNFFDDGDVLLIFKFWTFSIISLFLNYFVSMELAPSTGPTRVGAPDDEGRAIPQNIVV
jgi:hypothetical protein